jgi:type IV secretory pathway VirB4 component
MIKSYEEIQVRDDKDLELPFAVPPNLESVSIVFEASIQNISQQKTERLLSKYKVDLKTNNDQLTFYDSYLKKVDGKYKFLVLGKNGEPIPNIDVLFTFTH